MRGFFIVIILITVVGCSETTPAITIYSMEDVAAAGIKVKGGFETEFPETTDAKWAYANGREVAVLRYSNVELARTLGKTAAEEQTELIEVVEKNIAHGLKVEKTKCRGHGDTGGWTGRGGIRLDSRFNSNIGLDNTLMLNKLSLFENKPQGYPEARPCPRREPLYTEFIIGGNLVLMAEPVRDSSDVTMKFLEELISNLP
ncbi:MAG: hypothetical protein CL899_04230 [Dehalococcoidia bacterium]|nr:hypothetical protein [Dehalococcoidia bacterium]|tara:strand:- start:3 stop:605 length:603 start_codon:yes stop_codon:yes gene_type:complete